MFVQGATYPLELLADAQKLASEAAKHSSGSPRSPGPEERPFARAAIFTAFNFVEALLIELTQSCLADPAACPSVRADIEGQLRTGNANISRTIKQWPLQLGKRKVHGLAEFGAFKKLRQLRNHLIHPTLQPVDANAPTQDQLLQEADAMNAAWAVAEAGKMGRALYQSFGAAVPPELL
jgi:hypothetical protein